jgi:WD40 repeat protein
VWALNYNRDGSLLASGGPDKTVLIWDSKKNSAGIKITAHKDKVYATKFN